MRRVQTISNIFVPQTTFKHEQCSVGKDSEKRHLGGVAFTARGMEVVKWLLTERGRRKRSFDCPS